MASRCVVILLAVSFAALAYATTARADVVQARVANGTLAGVVADGIASYKGIPYAAPPVGGLRWRPPQPPAAWPGSLDAADYGHSCPQPDSPAFVHADSRAATTSEDCLTLNVWARISHPAPLPVMVFIHGGGNTTGTGSQTYYDGTSFAHDGVMLVTFNYRLGLLGFFAHPALSAEQPDSPRGNYGLLDQIAALQWVKANATAFGGDPSNVTVFGESAGGLDILALATSPLANGLFGRAIVESAGGAWISWPALSQAERHGADRATKFGLPGARATAAQLRSVPLATLAAGDEEAGDLIVDGRILTESPVSAVARGLSLPMLIGVNDEEGSLEVGGDPDQIFPHVGGADMAALRKGFTAEGITEKDAVASRLVADGFFDAPARWVAAHDTAAYLYRFDYIMDVLRSRRTGAHHGSEIPFVFESWQTSRLVDSDRAVGATLHACWIAFARTGTPNCPGAPAWPLYTRRVDRQMVFGTDATASVQPVRDAPEFDILERDLAKP